jgi:hypothetical protein
MRHWPGGGYAVFCPATDSQGAKELIRRIWAIASPQPTRGGVATFPLDALVLDDLIDLALVDARGGDEPGPPLDKSGLKWIRTPARAAPISIPDAASPHA